MVAEESRALVLRYFEGFANNNQDISFLKEIISPQIVDHEFIEGLFPTPRQRGMIEALPDMNDALDLIVAAEDQVAVRVLGSGTHLGGELFGVSATGKYVTWTATILWQITNGKITERWSAIDFLSLMIQIGVVPPFKNVIIPKIHERVLHPHPLANEQKDHSIPDAQDQLHPLRQLINALQTGNLTTLEEITAPDYVDHGGWIDGLPHGPEGLKQEVRILRAAFPELEISISHLFAAGEYAILRMTGTGIHRGEIFGVSATSQPATWMTNSIYRIEDGKIKERWIDTTRAHLLRQLGAIPQVPFDFITRLRPEFIQAFLS